MRAWVCWFALLQLGAQNAGAQTDSLAIGKQDRYALSEHLQARNTIEVRGNEGQGTVFTVRLGIAD